MYVVKDLRSLEFELYKGRIGALNCSVTLYI